MISFIAIVVDIVDYQVLKLRGLELPTGDESSVEPRRVDLAVRLQAAGVLFVALVSLVSHVVSSCHAQRRERHTHRPVFVQNSLYLWLPWGVKRRLCEERGLRARL